MGFLRQEQGRDRVNPKSTTGHAQLTTTRFGRRVQKPKNLQDFYTENITLTTKMRQCPHCGKDYVNGRNMKRHINQAHSSVVKAVRCPVSGCYKIYYMREYLRAHIR